MSDRVEFARPSYRPEQKASGLDPDMRRMAIAAAGFGGVLALIIGGLSLTRHASHVVPIIAAQAGPVRIKPANPGGMQVMGAETQAAPGAEKLSPPAEQPELRALHARLKPKTAPAVVAEAYAASPIAPPAPVQKASATQAAAMPPPAPLAGTEVQLAAFESQAAAEQEWGRMSEKMPDLFRPRRPLVERAEVAGRTVWRLRTGGFATAATAVEFCAKIRAKGGDCSIAAF